MARDWPKVKYFDMHLNGIISIILNPLRPSGSASSYDYDSPATKDGNQWRCD